jgi:hypothetical protein
MADNLKLSTFAHYLLKIQKHKNFGLPTRIIMIDEIIMIGQTEGIAAIAKVYRSSLL